MRKLGNLAKPKVTIQINDSVFYLKSESLRNFEINGKLDVEFDETPPDGRKCKVIFLPLCKYLNRQLCVFSIALSVSTTRPGDYTQHFVGFLAL